MMINISDPLYWYNTAQNPIWWRNQLVAPFSEEFTFRACMLPILLQCVSPGKAIFIAPLFFGVGELHWIMVPMWLNLTELQFSAHLILMSCLENS